LTAFACSHSCHKAQYLTATFKHKHTTRNNNTSLRHTTQILATRIQSLNTQARFTFSTYLHTWIVKRASPAALLWGSNFQVYLTLLPPKTCIRQPTSHELYPHLNTTKHTTNTSSKWSTTLEPLPAVAPATTVSYSPTIPRLARAACSELGTEFCRLRSSVSLEL
jgi:hypothetical protein